MARASEIRTETSALFSTDVFKKYGPADIVAVAAWLTTMHYDSIAAANSLALNYLSITMSMIDLTFKAYNQLILSFNIPQKIIEEKADDTAGQETKQIMATLTGNSQKSPGTKLVELTRDYIDKTSPIHQMESARKRRERIFGIWSECRDAHLQEPNNKESERKFKRASFAYVETDRRFRKVAAEAIYQIANTRPDYRREAARAMTDLVGPFLMISSNRDLPHSTLAANL